MSYVDGFVIPVPKKKLAAYLKMGRLCAKVWKELGAVSYVECVADDVPVGKWTSFPRGVKLEAGEIVVFSYITYKSRAARDRINAKAMKDKRLTSMMDPKDIPFDGKRMVYGGFKTVIDL